MAKAKDNLKLLYLLGFILAVSTAFPSYIQSSFIDDFVSLRWVGLFFSGAMIATLLAIIYFPRLIKRFTNHRLALIMLVLNFFSIFLMIAVTSPYWLFLFFVIFMVSSSLLWINMDVFVETFSVNKTTGKTRTTYNTLLNFGWVISPIIVGYILNYGDYRLIYCLAALILIPFFFILINNRVRLTDHVKYKDYSVSQTIIKMWSNLNLRGIFLIAFLLRLFYTIAVVYVPIYLNQNLGLSWAEIGVMFSLMLLPFVLFELPAGILADKRWGEKEILILGFVVIIISVLLMFWTQSLSPIVWGAILFLSRCGAALVEAMQETYFFKIVDVDQVDIINFFRTTGPLSYLIGTSLGVVMLSFLPLQYLFIFLAVILAPGIYFSWRLKDTA